MKPEISRGDENFVYCVKQFVLPARSEKLMQAKFGTGSEKFENTEIVVEPVSLPIQGVYSARALTKVSKNNCWIKMINVSEEDVTIHRNIKLGVVDEVSDIKESEKPSGKRQLLLFADSHGRELKDGLVERLPSSFEIQTEFVPNGKLKQIVPALKRRVESLTSNDLVIILRGTNDVYQDSPYLLTLHQAFMALPKTWKARVVFVSIPDRYDTNLITELRDANGLLERLVQRT